MSNWEIIKVQDIGQLHNGRAFKPNEWSDQGLPIIRIQNLNGSQDFNYYNGKFESKHEINYEDLLFAWSGSRGTSFGPYIWKGDKSLLNQHIFKVDLKEGIDKVFIYYMLKRLTSQIEYNAHGSAGLVHITKKELEKFELHLPPLKEQQKIAEILLSVDTAIEKTEQVIAKTEEIKKGLMQQLLTKGIGHTEFKQTEIGEIPVNWEVKQMKELCNLLNGRAYKKAELLDCGKTPVLRVGNFFTNQSWYYSDLELEENKYCDNGDLLYAWSASFGPRIWDGGKVIYHYHIWKLDLFDNINRDFMYYLLLNDVNRIKKSTTGSTMIHISKENMEPRLFAIPSLYEQEKIANILVNQDLMIKHECLKLDRLNNLKKGLMLQLLTGQTRVKID